MERLQGWAVERRGRQSETVSEKPTREVVGEEVVVMLGEREKKKVEDFFSLSLYIIWFLMSRTFFSSFSNSFKDSNR